MHNFKIFVYNFYLIYTGLPNAFCKLLPGLKKKVFWSNFSITTLYYLETVKLLFKFFNEK